MCGIVGYCGAKLAAPILLEGLSKLEYRGYDSAGLAVRDGSGEIEIVKAKGRLKELYEMTNDGKCLQGNCGIGHTRWATHGEPSVENAHPHFSDDHAVVCVHNGIIENYQELREKLIKKGYTFYSKTDTEVATKLIDYYYKKEGAALAAISRAMLRIQGSYAFAILFQDAPGEIYAARKDSPLILGVTDEEGYLASDVPAILKYTREVYYIGNMEIACLKQGQVSFYNVDQEPVEKQLTHIKWDAQAADKAGYEHFMMKEIHEQPRAVKETLNSMIHNREIDFTPIGLTDDELRQFSFIDIIACGSAYHAGLVAQFVIEDFAKIPVRVELASEFRYRKPILDAQHLVIVISQSGETADSLAALREAKLLGAKTLAIVNVVGSSIAREADHVFYTFAGPEIAVATTKAYSAQLAAGYVIALKLAVIREQMTQKTLLPLLDELASLPEKMERVLDDKERIQWFAAKFANAKDIFFIGRGLDYAISMEGSLKMKEISYIHSEAYAAGELKHGTISLIEKGTLVVGTLTQQPLYEKSTSNLMEVKSRGGYLMGLTNYGNYTLEDTADFTVYVPQTERHFAASLAILPLQLFGYYMSCARGLDVDKPRNLAKSVTVE